MRDNRMRVLNLMEKVETSRINLNMPCDLVYRVDEYARNMNINRTSAICVLFNLALDGQKAYKKAIDDFIEKMNEQSEFAIKEELMKEEEF